MSRQFAKLYADTGRPSIAPERLLRALLLQVFYSIRSERLLTEQLDYNQLFRWFVGMGIVETVCRNVQRRRDGDHIQRWVGSGLLVAERQFRRVIGHRHLPLLLSCLANVVSKRPIATGAAAA